MKATAIASPNIAIVKYWGKRDERLKLPMNDSISVTLDRSLYSETTVEFSKAFSADSMQLDGAEASEREMKNVALVLDCLRKKAKTGMNARIISRNNFPKSSGMASSASGYAALSAAAAAALNLQLDSRELSIAARLGSGSASRSVIGGFAWWKKGQDEDGSDSYAVQVADESHWKDFRIVTAVVSEEKKPVGSTDGMKLTLETSSLYRERLKKLPGTVSRVRQAILGRDAGQLFRLAMEESDSLHASMADTKPPLIYINESSREIMKRVNELNRENGMIAGYSFDAGPNAHIFTTEQNVNRVIHSIKGLAERIVASSPGKGAEVVA